MAASALPAARGAVRGPSSTQYWDGNGPADNGIIEGGAGVWNTTGKRFTGPAANTNSVWRDGVAVFDRPAGGGNPGTVTINGPIVFEGLTFTTDGYLLKSGTLAGTAFTAIGLPVGLTNIASILTNSEVTATIDAVIDGSAGISKDGACCTLILSRANTYTGGTTLNAGTVGIGDNSAFSTGLVTVAGSGASIYASKANRRILNDFMLNDALNSRGRSKRS